MVKATCAICHLNPASRAGEHIWPKWFLALMDKHGNPPHGWARNGVPIVNSSGEQIHLPKRQRVFLPVCTICNGALNKRFEEPAIGPVTALSTRKWLGPHSAGDWHAVGMWWSKIGLMLGHSEARYEHRTIDESAIRFDSPPPDYAWMVDGSGPPDSLSVFVHRSLKQAGQTEHRLQVPDRVTMDDGSVGVSHIFQIVTPEASISVVSHPGMTVVHPLVEAGDAWELLRNPPDKGDLAGLPAFGYRHVTFEQGLFANEGFQIDDSDSSRLLSLFPHDPMPTAHADPFHGDGLDEPSSSETCGARLVKRLRRAFRVQR